MWFDAVDEAIKTLVRRKAQCHTYSSVGPVGREPPRKTGCRRRRKCGRCSLGKVRGKETRIDLGALHGDNMLGLYLLKRAELRVSCVPFVGNDVFVLLFASA